jgi:hypothetical protein
MKHTNWLIQKIFYRHKSTPLKNLKVASEGSLYYDVTYIPQAHGNMCVDASENMLNAFYKKPIYAMVNNPRSMLEGKEFSHNLQEEMLDVDKLKTLLETKGPLIIGLPINFGLTHAVICIGHTKDHIIYHDPLVSGNRCISLKELARLSEENQHSDSAISVLYARPDPKVDLKTRQREVDPAGKVQTLKVKSGYANFFGLGKDSQFDWRQSVINILENYASGSRIFHPKRNHRDSVRRCVAKLKAMPDATAEQIFLRIQQELGGLSVKGSLNKRLDAIRKFTP